MGAVTAETFVATGTDAVNDGVETEAWRTRTANNATSLAAIAAWIVAMDAAVVATEFTAPRYPVVVVFHHG
jgi:hypothetical protein